MSSTQVDPLGSSKDSQYFNQDYMETRFVYFLIVKWTVIQSALTSKSMIQIYIFGARLIAFEK